MLVVDKGTFEEEVLNAEGYVLVDYYSEQVLESNSVTKFHAVSGVGTLDEVQTRINTALES
jgi:hypothetical protein